MTDLTAKIFRLTIGGVDWSNYCTEATLQWTELDLSNGLIFAKAEFTLDVSEVFPLPSYRRNPDQWAKGTAVLFECKNSVNAWVTPRFGKLFIAEVPKAPSVASPIINLSCCCALTLFDFNLPDGDASNVTVGTPRDRRLIIADVLAQNSIPTSFSSVPYPLDHPVPKQSGSWVDQAGKLAGAASHFLWQDNTGNVINQAIALNPSPIQTVTIGVNESEWEPSEGVELPPEKLIVSGVTYEVSPRTGITTITETEGNKRDAYPPLPAYLDTYVGVIERSTVVDYPYDEASKSQTTITTLEQCKITLNPNENYFYDSAYDLTTASISTDVSYYGDRNELIRQVCTKQQPRGVVNELEFQSNFYTLAVTEITTTEYFYTATMVVSSLKITTQIPKGFIYPQGLQSVFFDLVTSKTEGASWTSLATNRWLYVKSEKVAYQLRYPDSTASWLSFDLVQNPTTTYLSEDGSGAPPQTQYLTLNDLTETPITSCVYFQGLEADPYGDRTLTVSVEYGTSPDQLNVFGQNYNALIWGRRYGWRVGLPISDTLLSATPLSRINVVDGGDTYGLLMDGLTMVFSANESFAAFNGIEISYNSTPLYKKAIVATGTMNAIVSFSGAGTVTGNVLSSSVAITMTAEGTINQTDITGAIAVPITMIASGT
jgi:hypothetical protein